MMGRTRPWKVRFHYDGTKTFSDDESASDIYTIDTSRPIDGKDSYLNEGAAEAAARRISRNGGTARITLRDAATGDESEIRTYAPYEVAMEDLQEESAEFMATSRLIDRHKAGQGIGVMDEIERRALLGDPEAQHYIGWNLTD